MKNFPQNNAKLRERKNIYGWGNQVIVFGDPIKYQNYAYQILQRMQLALDISYRTFQRLVAKDSTLYMSEGHWFISLYNDFGDSQEIEFFATMSLEMTEGCPMGCNGHGECVLGRCKCESGYGGDDCSQGKKTLFANFIWILNQYGYDDKSIVFHGSKCIVTRFLIWSVIC